jgi:hypothetical protein
VSKAHAFQTMTAFFYELQHTTQQKQQQQHYRHTHMRELSASSSSVVSSSLISSLVACLVVIDEEYEEISFLPSTTAELLGDLLDLLIRFEMRKIELDRCDAIRLDSQG